MFTLGFPFEPWDGLAIADGPSILSYIARTAAKHGIDEKIRFRHPGRRRRLVERRGPLDPRPRGDRRGRRGPGGVDDLRVLLLLRGLLRLREPPRPAPPGLEDFTGTVVHPQFWPDDLDVTGKRVVVIGSGATAVTLVPALAADAAEVTMLQRTPTWITAVPARDRRRRPAPLAAAGADGAHQTIRLKNILVTQGFYEFCRRLPGKARGLLSGQAVKMLGGDEEAVREHFTPSYDPWDQRVCFVPDADFFKAVRRGRADGRDRHHRDVRARGDPAELRRGARGRRGGHRHRAPAASLRWRPPRRSTASRCRSPSSTSGAAPCSPGSPTSRCASATPTRPGRCAPT